MDDRSDQKKLLDEILGATLRSSDKNEQRTAAAYIMDSTMHAHNETLANYGISVGTKGGKPIYVAFGNKCGSLAGSGAKQVLKVLARLDGAKLTRGVRIGETRSRAVVIPWEEFLRVADVDDSFFGEEE